MKNKKDIQSLSDNRNIKIDRVGVKDIRYPIVVEDRKNGQQHTIANLDIYVELPHHHRGTHMSRFIEILNEFHEEELINNLEDFLQNIKKRLNSERAFVTIRFPYTIQKTSPISKINSILMYDCFFEASLDKEYHLTLGVKVPITTLCPCSKEISKYGAHNQRSLVTAKLRFNEFIWLEEIIEIIESKSSCEIYSLLKRPDEKYVTEKAYDKPMFVEDIVREITVAFKRDKRIDQFTIESENFESIHNHSAYACVSENWNTER